jgi:hypothetical protein
MILTPVVLALFGVYLIKSGSIVHEFAYPGARSGELDTQGLFRDIFHVLGSDFDKPCSERNTKN